MEVPIIAEERQQRLCELDRADGDHDVVEYLVREIGRIGVLITLPIRHGVCVMHGEDQVGAVDFKAIDDRFVELLDRGVIRQLTRLQLAEELPRRIIGVDRQRELIPSGSTTQRLFEGRQVVFGFALREGQRRLAEGRNDLPFLVDEAAADDADIVFLRGKAAAEGCEVFFVHSFSSFLSVDCGCSIPQQYDRGVMAGYLTAPPHPAT